MDISNLAGASCLGVYCKQCFTNSGFPKSFVSNSALVDHFHLKHGISKNQRAEVIDAVRTIRAREANGVVRYFDDERRDGFFCNYCNAHFYEHRKDEMIKTHMKRYCNRKGEAISITRFIFKTAISGHHVILDSDVNEDSHSSDSNDDGDSGESEDSHSIDYNGDIDSEVDKDGHSIDYNGDIDSDGDSDGDSEDSEVMEEDEKSEDDSDGDEKVLEYAREIIDLTMDSSDEDKVVEVVVVDSSDSKTNSSDSTTHSLVSTNHSEELELLADTALRGIFGNQEDSDEDVEQVKKYLNGIKQKYTKKDMKQSDFEKRKKDVIRSTIRYQRGLFQEYPDQVYQ